MTVIRYGDGTMEIRENPPVAIINPPTESKYDVGDNVTCSEWGLEGKSTVRAKRFDEPNDIWVYKIKLARGSSVVHGVNHWVREDTLSKHNPVDYKPGAFPGTSDVSDLINNDVQELLELYDEVDTSDLQGIAMGMAMKYVEGGAKNIREVMELQDKMLEQVYGTIRFRESNVTHNPYVPCSRCGKPMRVGDGSKSGVCSSCVSKAMHVYPVEEKPLQRVVTNPKFNQDNNPEDYWPSDADTHAEAYRRYGQHWDALGSDEMDDILDSLINEHYMGRKNPNTITYDPKVLNNPTGRPIVIKIELGGV